MNALDGNIKQRFPEDVITVHKSLDIFNIDMIPNDADVKFAIYGNAEMSSKITFLMWTRKELPKT